MTTTLLDVVMAVGFISLFVIITPRGIYNPKEQVRLDQAVKNLVQKNLDVGNTIRLSARDVVRMYESGKDHYVIPNHIDPNNRLSIHAYCCGILHDMELNHGSMKQEELGFGMVYEFTPNSQKVKA